jgi:hypothetical protein
MTNFPVNLINYFNKEDIDKVTSRYAKELIRTIDDVFDNYWTEDAEIRWRFPIVKMSRIFGVYDYLIKKERSTLGKAYNSIDARELNKQYGGNKAAEIALEKVLKILNSIDQRH